MVTLPRKAEDVGGERWDYHFGSHQLYRQSYERGAVSLAERIVGGSFLGPPVLLFAWGANKTRLTPLKSQTGTTSKGLV